MREITSKTKKLLDDMQKEMTRTTKDSNAKLNEIRKETNIGKRVVNEEATKGIQAVAIKVTDGVQHITKTMESARTTTTSLTNEIKFASAQSNALNGLSAHVNKQIEAGYESFGDRITNRSDNAMEEINQFLDKHTMKLTAVQQLMDTTNHEREITDLEKQFVERDRELIKEQMEKLRAEGISHPNSFHPFGLGWQEMENLNGRHAKNLFVFMTIFAASFTFSYTLPGNPTN